MTTWLISDPHFGHSLAARDRGFESPEEHDRWLLSKCARMLQTRDEVWWLGDIAFAGWRDRLPNTVGSLPGTHHLVLGNHDRAHPLNSRGHAYLEETRVLGGFATVQTAARLSIGGQSIMLSHFPYDDPGNGSPDGWQVDRYAEWRLVDTGRTLIHGHTHSREKVSHSLLGTLQLHAGVDAWSGPVSLGEVLGSYGTRMTP